MAVPGCGADNGATVTTTTPRTATATASRVTPPVRDAPLADGQRVFEQSGCFACHQIETKGNSGPGNNLTGVGGRMSRTELLRALVNPTSPMPSYRQLPSGKLDDLIAYLSSLRANASVPPCPDGADCG